MREGAQPERVSQWLYESQPEGAVRLLGEMLRTLALHDGGRVATVHLDARCSRRAGAVAGDSEGLVDSPRSIAGVEAVALLRETGAGRSGRCRCAAAARSTSRRSPSAHGGGGHRNAAGCTVEGELAERRDSASSPTSSALAQRRSRVRR